MFVVTYKSKFELVHGMPGSQWGGEGHAVTAEALNMVVHDLNHDASVAQLTITKLDA